MTISNSISKLGSTFTTDVRTSTLGSSNNNSVLKENKESQNQYETESIAGLKPTKFCSIC